MLSEFGELGRSGLNNLGINSKSETAFDRMAIDLRKYVEEAQDQSTRLSFLAKKIGIHKKTLQRILNNENKASYPTIIKFYRFYLNVENEADIIAKAPAAVSEFLTKECPKGIDSKSFFVDSYTDFLQSNPVAFELILLCSTKNLSRSEIEKYFGSYGFNLAKKLVDKNLLSERSLNVFSVGPQQISFSPELIVKAGLISIENYAKPENGYEAGKHFIGYYCERLTEVAYKRWIQIDQDAMKKKMEIANLPESKGSLPAFTFNIVENFNAKLKAEDT